MTANKLLRNIHVLNLGLAAAILYFVFFLLFPLTEMPVTYYLPPVKKAAPEKTETEAPAQQTPNPMEYTLIADQNLFHPERIIPPEKKAEAPLPKPEFVLYGTLITSDLGIAYLEDKKVAPVTTPGRGKRQTAVKKGESLSGFILKELFSDRVVMNRGEETMIVYLNDPQAPKAREGVLDPTKTAAPRAPATTPGPSRPGTSPACRKIRARTAAPPAVGSQNRLNTPGRDEWSSLSGGPGDHPRNPPGPLPPQDPGTGRYRRGPYPAPSPAPFAGPIPTKN